MPDTDPQEPSGGAWAPRKATATRESPGTSVAPASVAVLSDAHGNLQALEAVVEAARARGADHFLCLGDVVGYGADPGPCLRRLRELTETIVLGNHDAAVAGLQDLTYFNPQARAAARWTTAVLREEELRFLSRLPLALEWGDALLVHADPRAPDHWAYIETAAAAAAAMEAVTAKLCFVGHSHRPFIAALAGPAGIGGPPAPPLHRSEGPRPLDPGRRYLVNAGSVGQPRDGDPRASFALWDRRQNQVELVRVSYDVAAAQARIRDAGLPPVLADRLAVGW
ncbi:MAG: metallophosphoesterase family protein [Gemmatimonadota bacterium]